MQSARGESIISPEDGKLANYCPIWEARAVVYQTQMKNMVFKNIIPSSVSSIDNSISSIQSMCLEPN
jgi:hypothetical protein